MIMMMMMMRTHCTQTWQQLSRSLQLTVLPFMTRMRVSALHLMFQINPLTGLLLYHGISKVCSVLFCLSFYRSDWVPLDGKTLCTAKHLESERRNANSSVAKLKTVMATYIAMTKKEELSYRMRKQASHDQWEQENLLYNAYVKANPPPAAMEQGGTGMCGSLCLKNCFTIMLIWC